MQPASLSPQQLRYLDSIIGMSEEELLYEIAREMLSGVTNSVRPDYEIKAGGPGQSKEERREARRNAVPDKPVDEYVKPLLEPHLPEAKEKAQSILTKIHQLLCDEKTQKPKEWALDIATGETRNLVVIVAAQLAPQHIATITVILASVAWSLKGGLHLLCATKV